MLDVEEFWKSQKPVIIPKYSHKERRKYTIQRYDDEENDKIKGEEAINNYYDIYKLLEI